MWNVTSMDVCSYSKYTLLIISSHKFRKNVNQKEFKGEHNKVLARKLTYGSGYRIADRTSAQRYRKIVRRNRYRSASQPCRNTQGTSQYMLAPLRELQIDEY